MISRDDELRCYCPEREQAVNLIVCLDNCLEKDTCRNLQATKETIMQMAKKLKKTEEGRMMNRPYNLCLGCQFHKKCYDKTEFKHTIILCTGFKWNGKKPEENEEKVG